MFLLVARTHTPAFHGEGERERERAASDQSFQKKTTPTVLVDYLREHKGLAVPPAERIFLTGNAPPAGNGDEGGNSDPENSHSLPVLVVLCVLGLGVLVLSLLAIILLRRSSASSFARLQEPQEGGNAV